MDGYSVTEAASVLGVPTERVWELLARGILAGSPESETGMRVFLQPRPGAPPTDPLRERTQNGNGGTRESATEMSPFRELLTEFRSLTERYGQALLALGEARGEVASLRSRVDLLEARIDLRLPISQAAPWPTAPMPASPPAEPARGRTDVGAEPVTTEEPPRRRRHRSGRPDVAEIAEALARADDPSRPELPEVRPEAAAPAGLAADAEEPEPVTVAPEHEREAEADQPEGALAEAVAAEPEPVAAEPEPVAAEPEPVVAEPEPVVAEPEPVVAEPEPVAAEPEPVAAESVPLPAEPEPVVAEPEPVVAEPEMMTGAEGEQAWVESQPATMPTDETAADVAEAAGAAEAELIPPEETLQAHGDWPAAAPTIDVADAADEAEVSDIAATEVSAAMEGRAAADEGGAALESERVSPLTGEEAPVAIVEDRSLEAAPTEAAAWAPAEEHAPSDEAPAEEWAEATPSIDQAPAEGAGDQLADAVAADEPTGQGEPAPGEPPAAGSPYEAAVEEPDWFSEEDIGGPVAGEPYEPWGTAAEAPAAPRPSWSIWDTEEAVTAEADTERPAEAQAEEPSSEEPPPPETDPAAAEPPEQAPPADVGHAPSVEAAEGAEAEPRDEAHEEQVLWLGDRPEAGTQPADADDAAAEMEVAATGWHPADRGDEAPRRDGRAIELPGARELEDALAALRRRAGGPEASGPAAPPAHRAAPDEPTTRPPSEASPAQRAYARLRRILPR